MSIIMVLVTGTRTHVHKAFCILSGMEQVLTRHSCYYQ